MTSLTRCGRWLRAYCRQGAAGSRGDAGRLVDLGPLQMPRLSYFNEATGCPEKPHRHRRAARAPAC